MKTKGRGFNLIPLSVLLLASSCHMTTITGRTTTTFFTNASSDADRTNTTTSASKATRATVNHLQLRGSSTKLVPDGASSLVHTTRQHTVDRQGEEQQQRTAANTVERITVSKKNITTDDEQEKKREVTASKNVKDGSDTVDDNTGTLSSHTSRSKPSFQPHDYDRKIANVIDRSHTIESSPLSSFRSLISAPTDQPTTSNVISCPQVGSPPIDLSPGSIMLNYGSNDALCTLTKRTVSDTGSTSSIPIAVSYSNNPWEQSAGEFASSLFANENILCYSNSCQINLPPLGVQESYVLTTTEYSLSDDEMYARFLETSTFGTTQEQLNTFKSSPGTVHDNIANWISDQMNSTATPLTSHREFWRRGANGRHPTSTPEANGDHPCDLYSRWRKLSFVQQDVASSLKVIGDGPFQLEMDGWLRTVTDNLTVQDINHLDYVFDPTFIYKLCRIPEERIGGSLFLQIEDGTCVEVKQNPLLNLNGFESSVGHILDLPDENLQGIDQWWTDGDEFVYRLDTSLFDNPALSETCSSLPSVPQSVDAPIFGRLSDGTWMMFDPRIDLQMNTPNEPSSDGGKQASIDSSGIAFCSNVPRTFLNENECQLTTDACDARSLRSQVDILLQNSTIAALNNLTGHYVYAIKGLQVNHGGMFLEHPCTPGLRSRWERKDLVDCTATELYDATANALFQLLSNSRDDNPFMRDIYFPEEGTFCDSSDTEPEIEIEVNGDCWTRVHPEHMSVFDMTYWVDHHPGGSYNIQKWSENNGTILVYPSLLESNPHSMSRWNNHWHKFTFVGRFGDYLSLSDLPSTLRGIEVTNYFGSTKGSDSTHVLVCGSPGEVNNDKNEGFQFDISGVATTNVNYLLGDNRKFVWTMIGLGAADQLRQRVSWAMSQILVVVKMAITSQAPRSEQFLAYYDIFVRNAFGNYRNILREISYNALMAENLSFLQSKSSAYMLERFQIKISADENFAREIMQLFSMGVRKINMDGSPKLDADGNTMLAYTNDDIESLSRAWTGFDLQQKRGNIEGFLSNTIDPMRIVPDWRDKFPKTETTGGYIGDNYPLCNDFPSKPFLKKGAIYRLLGGSNLPELMEDNRKFRDDERTVRAVLSETSTLRSLLCNEDQSGNCDFKNSVTLETNHNCTGIECNIDTVRVVEVEPNMFYEFVHPPCVTFPFYNDAVKISRRVSTDLVMCADPRLAVASEACCDIDSALGERNSVYTGERVTFATAENRCISVSKSLCNTIDGVYGPQYMNQGYYWNSDSCLLQAKVKRDGTLTIVHKPSSFSQRVDHVDVSNENYFKVYWEQDGNYPTVDNNCGGVCEILSEGTCLCNTGVVEETVFNSMPASKSDIHKKLSVGALDPSVLESDAYTSTVGNNGDFTAHLKDNEFSSETIFEYEDDKGRTFFVKNIHSSVHLLDMAGNYTGQSFRNAPQFMSFIPSETNLRDAQYETEAVLDHYFFHDNTAPFLAMRLIQRLVMSNPGPRYIQTVAEAFKSGSYVSGSASFGTGRYGDLSATFAAIYLDRAARNVLLDKDIASGAIREPVLKVMSLMRSMEFVSLAPVIITDDVVENIGQMAHEFDTVFSFFLPEFKPYGRIGDALLVSPEATLLDIPKIVGLLNGLSSMVKFGLSGCDKGFAGPKCGERSYLPSPNGILEFNKTYVGSESAFSSETFEGPSLKGGLDNRWVGKGFDANNGKTIFDPTDNNNNVLHFPVSTRGSDFFSPPVPNLDSNVNSVVVKFRYLGLQLNSGGCIGYVDGSHEFLTTQTWALCDNNGSTMQSNGQWISCQFVVPSDLASFRITVADILSPGGDAYFDDIQIGSGNITTCTGVDVPKLDPPGEEGYSSTVVDRLSTLLTAGRLNSKTKSIIVDAFDSAGSADDGLNLAQQLIITTSEFHTTNTVESTEEQRDKPTFPQSTGKPYKAVIYLMFGGGCDSFNMLTPYNCNNDLYQSYLDVRQQVAIQKEFLLPINASDQVCTEFGLHPDLPAIKTLYDDEDLLFFANTGALSQPVNKDNYYTLTNMQLFSHNHMQEETRTIDPYKLEVGTGILGRMTDVLTQYGYNTGSFAVEKNSAALVGKPGVSNSPVTVGKKGFPRIYLDSNVENSLSKLHNKTELDSGFFADLWSASLMESIGNNDLLSNLLDTVYTTTKFPDNDLGRGLETIARLIATKDVREVDVDTFYIQAKGFDTHAYVESRLSDLFVEVNSALDAFTTEMKYINLWKNVTLIQTSDFGRTLNPNGNDGTDHAWGGNYMMMGGSVKGRQVLGKYPEDLTDNGPLGLGRGRLVPTTPWDSPFSGIASWLGIGVGRMDEVCPNLHKFNSSYLISAEDMFTELNPVSTPSPVASTPSPSVSPTLSPSVTLSPSIFGFTPTPTVAHTSAPSVECSADNLETKLSLTSDSYPEETSWTIEDSFGTIIKSDEGRITDSKTQYNEEVCLDPLVCYKFTINDSYGDGIQPPGKFSLSVNGDVKLSNPKGKSDYRYLNVEFGNCESGFCGNDVCDINEGEGCGSCASDCFLPMHCNVISNYPSGWTYSNFDSYGMVFDVSVGSRSVYFYELAVHILQRSTAKVYVKEGPYSADKDLKNWNLVFSGSVSASDYELIKFDSRFYAEAFSTVSFYISYGSPGAFIFTAEGNELSNGDVTVRPGMLLHRQRGHQLPNFVSSVDGDADFVDSLKYDYAQSPTPAPTASPTSTCYDKGGVWDISNKSKDWCAWARKAGESEISTRCAQKKLYQDCPFTCDSCDWSPAPVTSTPAPVTSTPAPVPTSSNCSDRTDEWTIGRKTLYWCSWATKGGADAATIAHRCDSKNLQADCPETCGSCNSTPAPVPASSNCSDRTDEWTIGRKTLSWCSWATKGGADAATIAHRCDSKNLQADCPETCGACTP